MFPLPKEAEYAAPIILFPDPIATEWADETSIITSWPKENVLVALACDLNPPAKESKPAAVDLLPIVNELVPVAPLVLEASSSIERPIELTPGVPMLFVFTSLLTIAVGCSEE